MHLWVSNVVPTALQAHDCVYLYLRGLERLPSMGAEILLEVASQRRSISLAYTQFVGMIW